jgi:membrane protease YdiL (CAAX protease family)
MPVHLPALSPIDLALLVPSLAAFGLVYLRWLRPGPRPPEAGWTAAEVLLVICTHFLAGAIGQIAFDVPALPKTWATGGALVVADSLTCLFILAIAGRRRSLETLGLRPPDGWMGLVAVAVLYLSFLIPLGCLAWAWMRLLETAGYVPTMQPAVQLYIEARGRGDWIGLGILALGAVAVAPVVEEVLFRGFLFGALRERIGPKAGAVAASAIFAAFHVYPEVVVPIFFVGLVLNLVYLRTGSLVHPILFHVLFNGGTLAVTALQESR